MIGQLQIENHVEQKSGACLEVFSSIVATKSPATKKAAIATAETYCTNVLKSFTDNSNVLKSSSIAIAAQKMDLASLIDFASAVDAKMQNEPGAKTILKTGFLRNLGIRWISFMYDLDYARLKSLRSTDLDLYYEIGDAIFLAGVYLSLGEKAK